LTTSTTSTRSEAAQSREMASRNEGIHEAPPAITSFPATFSSPPHSPIGSAASEMQLFRVNPQPARCSNAPTTAIPDWAHLGRFTSSSLRTCSRFTPGCSCSISRQRTDPKSLICGEKNSKSPPSWTLLIATHHILDNERSRHVPFWERMPPEIVDLFFADVAAKHPNNSMLLSLAREFGIIESTLLGPVAAMVTGSRWHRI
jgi:hypothetical protein